MARFRMRDGSGVVELRYIKEDVDRHGNVRLYVRRKGRPLIRLREQPGTPAFLAEYRAALEELERQAPVSIDAKNTSGAAPPGSLSWLLERYYQSGEFKSLDERTQRVRRLILEKVRAKDGAKPYRLMEARHVARMRDARSDKPEAANSIVKALRQVFAWAMQPHVDLADRNPAKDVPYLKPGGSGFHSWTIEEVEQYEARWPVGTKARLALALFLYLGVRRADAAQLGRQMVRNGWITFTVSKGRRRNPRTLSLPILPVLQEIIDASPTGDLTYLVTEFGKPFTPAGLGNKMREWCDAAGLPHCSAHGLRKAGAALAAERGASERQLMAIFGWKTMKEAARYTEAARQKVLAAEAMGLLERAPAERGSNESVPPSDGAAAGGTILPLK